MTAVETSVGPRLDFGTVINTTLSVLKRNFSSFLLVAAIFTGVSAVVAVPFQLAFMPKTIGGMPDFSGPTLILGALAIVVGVVASCWMQIVLIRATLADLRGEKPSPMASLGSAAPMILPMVGLAFVWGLGFVFGWLLLLVPGVIVALMWAVATPVMVVEGKGVLASLGRSRDLTRRNRWAILGLMVVYGVAYMLVYMLISAIVGAATAMSSQPSLGQIIASLIVAVPSSVVATTGVTVIYWRLRAAKEGIGPDQLATVFD